MLNLSAMAGDNKKKLFLYLMLDIICINFSIIAAICLWYGGTIPGLPGEAAVNINDTVWQWFAYASLFTTPVCLIIYGLFRFYSNLWKYATIDDVFKIVIADTIIFIWLYIADKLFISMAVDYPLPKRMILVGWIIDIILFMLSRSGYRFIKKLFIQLSHILDKKSGSKRVLVAGAGYAGYNVVRSIINSEKGYENRTAVIVTDDDILKNNTNIMGVRVTHNMANIPRLAREYEIDEIVVAVPSANNVQIKRIMDFCTQTNCSLKMIPPMSDISSGSYQRLRDVNIADLLCRDEVELDINSISDYLENKVVLVTGGGGSIGSELCRQISKFCPEKLIIFDIYENNAYELYNELKNKYNDKLNIIVRIGSIRDMSCLEKVFKDHKPDVVFHAAAHKHVPLMEFVPGEAVKNNVFGTLNAALCADRFKCDRFVLLSTDKAVNPTNIMGATKRITELIIQHLAVKSKTKYSAVRFGNVLGSSGSVIPLFQRQIKSGGPVTVTHPDITRFFMTIPEASRLVLQAAALGESGKIFVLDMGEPVKIDNLARNLIRLSGYIPDKDIKIEYTGLRPGEKLYEELIMNEERENMKKAFGDKIFVTEPFPIDYKEFDAKLNKLKDAAYKYPEKVPSIIKEILPNFKPEGDNNV